MIVTELDGDEADETLRALHEDLCGHLNEIRQLFVADADIRLTLVIRTDQGDQGGDIVLTNDDLDGVIGSIEASKKKGMEDASAS